MDAFLQTLFRSFRYGCIHNLATWSPPAVTMHLLLRAAQARTGFLCSTIVCRHSWFSRDQHFTVPSLDALTNHASLNLRNAKPPSREAGVLDPSGVTAGTKGRLSVEWTR